MQHLADDYPLLAQLYSYWLSRCGSRRWPRRRDFARAEIAHLIPHTQFIERTPRGEYRYAFTGAAIIKGYGYDPTGRFVRDVLPESRLMIARRNFSRAWDTGRPTFARTEYLTDDGLDRVATRVILPLSEDGRTINTVLMAQTFDYWLHRSYRTYPTWSAHGTIDNVRDLESPNMAEAYH